MTFKGIIFTFSTDFVTQTKKGFENVFYFLHFGYKIQTGTKNFD